MFVYIIVNEVSGKFYIGKTISKNLGKYLKDKIWEAEHRSSLRSHLYAAIRKCGPEHFHIFPLISDCQTNDELCHWERLLIKALKSQHPDIGYNICRGGEGFTGPHSPETKKKIADASVEMWKREDIRENFTAKVSGRPANHTPEGREAIRLSRLGAKATPETLQKLQDSHTGLTRSQESRIKQAASVTGEKNHFHGRTHSSAARAKQRAVRLRNLDKYPMPSPHKKVQA